MSRPDVVSIVIPVYKTEPYLNRCIESVVGQTYTDLEILLIDDASPDNCPAICDAWAQKDPRIRVIHKENQGAGMARNTGIENATGKYICFFDSDDYVEPTLISRCHQLIVEHSADMVCFGNDRRTPQQKVIGQRKPCPPKSVYEGSEIKEVLLPMSLSQNARSGEDWNLSLSDWCNMISMDVIRKTDWKFVSEHKTMAEDYYSMFALYGFLQKIVITNEIFYHYTACDNSLSTAYRKDRYEKIRQFAIEIRKLSKQMNCPDHTDKHIDTIFLGFTLGALKQIETAQISNRQKIKAFKAVICDDYYLDVLKRHRYDGENIQKKIIFWASKRKLYTVCYWIVRLKNLAGHS